MYGLAPGIELVRGYKIMYIFRTDGLGHVTFYLVFESLKMNYSSSSCMICKLQFVLAWMISSGQCISFYPDHHSRSSPASYRRRYAFQKAKVDA